MTTPQLSQLLEQTDKICSPPLIYLRLNEAINHPRTSVKDIGRIVSEDSGLTARILKIANSPIYGRSGVDSINRAITILGTRELRDVCLALHIVKAFPHIPEHLFNIQTHWQHSIACGTIARNIAIYLREAAIERYFVAGILHDLGQMILCASAPQTIVQMLERIDTEEIPLDQMERQLLGFDHADLGGGLLKRWGVPANIAALVQFHHRPSQTEDYQRDATIIHLADIMAQALNYGLNAERVVTCLDTEAVDVIELPLNELETIIKQTNRQLDTILPIMMA